LPAALVALSLLTMALLHLQTQTELRYTCRKELLATEKAVGQNLSELMKLNPLAQSLRLHRKLALLKLAAVAANPAAEAAVLAELARIEQQQVALGQRQKALLLTAQAHLRLGSLRTEMLLSSLHRQKSPRFQKLAHLSLSQLYSSASHLAVRADDPTEVAPTYELEPHFEEQQSLQTFWRLEYSWLNSTWIQRFLHWRKILISDSCRASLREKAGQFRAILNEDRF
jgi:hypothetical protein